MQHLIDSLGVTPPIFDTVLHLGAGPFFQESLYEAISANNFILVEANPDFVKTLRLQAPNSTFQVLEHLVGEMEKSQIYRRFSLPSLNGIFPLGEVQRIYPRAVEVGSQAMDAKPVVKLLETLNLKNDGKNALLFDVPGLESSLLESDIEKLAGYFDWIFVFGAGEPHMEGAKPLSETIKILQRYHYSLLAHDAARNPILPSAIFHRNALAVEKEMLQAQCAVFTKERDEQAKMAAERQVLLVGVTKELEASKASGADLEKKRAELAGQLDARTKERDEARTERDAHLRERDNLKKTVAERAARIAELEAQVADQAERQKQIDEQMLRAETQLEMLKEFLKPAFQ